jgi:hypothetical protein
MAKVITSCGIAAVSPFKPTGSKIEALRLLSEGFAIRNACRRRIDASGGQPTRVTIFAATLKLQALT